ncbi:MAG: response regulator [Sporomusaceae bacterium]|nr:response regulator [Sporomusaceae bacterium]
MGKKILIIDDSRFIRLQVKRILEEYGVEVYELDNAEDFFAQRWRFRDINLLLLDINLKGMDGIAALEEMQRLNLQQQIPVIMVSGIANRLVIQKSLCLGASHYIRKPFSDEDLLDRIENVMGSLVAAPMQASSQQEILNSIYRAKRDHTEVSFVSLGFNENLANGSFIMEQLKNTLRVYDSVLLATPQNLLLILPFTKQDGTNVVINKAKKKLSEILPTANDPAIHFITFPTDESNPDMIAEILKIC